MFVKNSFTHEARFRVFFKWKHQIFIFQVSVVTNFTDESFGKAESAAVNVIGKNLDNFVQVLNQRPLVDIDEILKRIEIRSINKMLSCHQIEQEFLPRTYTADNEVLLHQNDLFPQMVNLGEVSDDSKKFRVHLSNVDHGFSDHQVQVLLCGLGNRILVEVPVVYNSGRGYGRRSPVTSRTE